MPVYANGRITYLEDVFYEISDLSAGELNADLVPQTDISEYSWISLQVLGTWVGTLSFQGSNNASDWAAVNLTVVGTYVQLLSSTTINNLFSGSKAFRYFRVRMTSYTSGTATGVLELYKDAPTPLTVGANVSLLYGANNIGTVQLASQTAAIATGTTTEAQVIRNSAPGYLKGALVTATGSANLVLYDHSSAASGLVIGVIPSTATVGQFFPMDMPVSNGITAGKVNGSPAVTVVYI